MTKVLITGASGQLGSALTQRAPTDWRIVTPSRAELDLSQPGHAADLIGRVQPHVVFNCAAFTDVDGAESDDSAWRVNADAPAELASACAESGARLVHISTDYVFDGQARSPYPEDAPISGLGVYGRSKAAGETTVLSHAATVVRTAWLYGAHGRNFVSTMLRLAASGQTLRVVDDQIGQPTYAEDLAVRLIEMVGRDVPPGIYHGTNSGQTSWFGFATEILRLWGFDNLVEPVGTAEFSRPAPRPAYSVLGHGGWSTVGMAPMRPWREALAEAHADHAADFGDPRS